jgi:hypothetical protein
MRALTLLKFEFEELILNNPVDMVCVGGSEVCDLGVNCRVAFLDFTLIIQAETCKSVCLFRFLSVFAARFCVTIFVDQSRSFSSLGPFKDVSFAYEGDGNTAPVDRPQDSGRLRTLTDSKLRENPNTIRRASDKFSSRKR